MLEIYKFDCFTTPCEVQLYSQDKKLADTCAKEILGEAKRLEKKYNYFDSNSLISSINNRTTNLLDNESKTLLSRAKQYYSKTNSIFDITLATIKDIYTQNNTIEEINTQKESLSKYIGCEHFAIKKNKIYFDNDFTKIDLGGFVKEYSVDRAVSIIKKNKIKSALVNFGGDIFAIGTKPNGEKFSIGIKNPKQKDEILFSIDIENEALTTSASYERYVTIENTEISHILSKKESNKTVLSATVISNSCVESGVYTTSLMVNKDLEIKHSKYLINKDLELLK